MKQKRLMRLSSLMLVLVMVISLMPITNVTVWGAGTGTISDPILINDAAGLATIGSGDAGTFYKLTSDITINKDFTTISSFKGILDGDGHTISGLEVYFKYDKASDDTTVITLKGMLFGTIEENAVVRDIYFDSPKFTTDQGSVGRGGDIEHGLIAKENKGIIDSITMENMDINVSLANDNARRIDDVGGIVHTNRGKIMNVSQTGSINVGNNHNLAPVAIDNYGVVANINTDVDYHITGKAYYTDSEVIHKCAGCVVFNKEGGMIYNVWTNADTLFDKKILTSGCNMKPGSYSYICMENKGLVKHAYYAATEVTNTDYGANYSKCIPVPIYSDECSDTTTDVATASATKVEDATNELKAKFKQNQNTAEAKQSVAGLISGDTPVYTDETRANKRILILKNGNGTIVKSEPYNQSLDIKLPIADNIGYYCSKWKNEDNSTTYNSGDTVNFTTNVILSAVDSVAQWYPEFTGSEAITYASGEELNFKAPDGYDFCNWKKTGESGTVTTPSKAKIEAAGIRLLLLDPSVESRETFYSDDEWKTPQEWYNEGKYTNIYSGKLVYKIEIPDTEAAKEFKSGTYDMFEIDGYNGSRRYIDKGTYAMYGRKLTADNVDKFITFDIADDMYHEDYDGNYDGVTRTSLDGYPESNIGSKITFKKQGTTTEIEKPQEPGTYEIWFKQTGRYVTKPYIVENDFNTGETYTISPQKPKLSLQPQPISASWANDLTVRASATVEKNRATGATEAVTGYPSKGKLTLTIKNKTTDEELLNETKDATAECTFTLSKGDIPNAGTELVYDLTYVDDSGCYNTANLSPTEPIGKANATISMSTDKTSCTYGEDIVVTVTAPADINPETDITVTDSTNPTASITYDAQSSTKAGEYVFKYSKPNAGTLKLKAKLNAQNYNTAETDEKSVNVDKKPLTVTVQPTGEFKYDSEAKVKLNVSGLPEGIASVGVSDLKLIIKDTAGDKDFAVDSTQIPITDKEVSLGNALNAGTYDINIGGTISGADNYKLPTDAIGSITIGKRDAIASDFTYDSSSITGLVYNGSAKDSITVNKTAKITDGTVDKKFTTADNTTSFLSGAPDNAGAYILYGTVTGDKNINDGTVKLADFTIEKKMPTSADLTIKLNNADFNVGDTTDYTGNNVIFNVISKENNGFNINALSYKKVAGLDVTDLTEAPKDPGSYKLYVSTAESDNYKAASNIEIPFGIDKVVPILTLNSIESAYDYDKALTVTGTIKGINTNAAKPTGTLTGKVSHTTLSDYQKDITYNGETGEFSFTFKPKDYADFKAGEQYRVSIGYSGDSCYLDTSKSTADFTVNKSSVTYAVSNTQHTYTSGSKKEIIVTTPNIDNIPDNGIEVKYYLVDENAEGHGKLSSDVPVIQAVSPGKYMYVINLSAAAKVNYTSQLTEYEVTSTTIPDDLLTAYGNVGFMYITSGTDAAQKPIYFENSVVNAKMTDTITNNLTNPNGTSVTYESSNTSVATVDPATGQVTIKGAGTVVIVATSHKENTTDVYASYTLNVIKEVITVTANSKSITYGDVLGDNTYTVSKTGITLDGTPAYTTDYRQGDGIGKYEINVSGLTSDIYDIQYASGKLMVEPKTLDIDDFDIQVKTKTYDTETSAQVNATVKSSSIFSGDKVTVLAEGNFADATAGTQKDVNCTITGISGKDSNNYVLSANLDKTVKADINKAKVSVSVPAATTYVYDEQPKSVNVVAYANGMYFDDITVSYTKAGSVATPIEVGVYNVSITPNDTVNYEIEGTITATLTIKSAQQDFFSIEGISDTVTYGETPVLQTAGAIEGGTVTYEITSGGEYATLNADNSITISSVGKVTVKATSRKANYNDKTASRTFVISPKTISVSAVATDKVYDGNKDVDVSLTPVGVVGSDIVNVSKASAMVATADVENQKTVFVNGLSIDNSNYQLSATSIQTTVNITKKEITAVEFATNGKVYDGTKDADYSVTKLVGVTDADAPFVTVTGVAEFNSENVNDANKVTLSNLVLSGTKSGNYDLKVSSAEKTGVNITKATVNFTLGTLSYVYDGKEKTVPVTAEVNGKAFNGGYNVTYGGAANQINAGEYDIAISLTDSNNYESDYTTPKKLEILKADQSAMTITGLVGTIDYGREFSLTAVGGDKNVATKWESSKPNVAEIDANTGLVKIKDTGTEVTITAKKVDVNGNFTDQSATVTFTPVKKVVSIKVTDLSQVYDGSGKQVSVTTVAPNTTVEYFDENGQAVSGLPVNAGTYYVDVKATGNYEGEQSAVLTIKKATYDMRDVEITVTNATTADAPVTYGDTYTVTSNYQGTDSKITFTGTGLYGEQEALPQKAGSYMAILTVGDDNHEKATVSKKFDIAKKKLTAKADDKSRYYGDNNPEFTVTLSGFAYGDSDSSVLVRPTASTEAHSSSTVGTYDIIPQNGYADNYYFEYVNGTLTVNPAIKGNFYITGGNANTNVGASFTLSAYCNNESPTVEWESTDTSIATVNKTTGYVEIVGVGSASIIAKMNDARYDSNMTAKFDFTSAKKRISLSASATDLVKVYNGEIQNISFECSSVNISDIKINTTYVMTTDPGKTSPKDVGTYSVSYEIDDDLYEGDGNFTLVINKATVTVTGESISKEYGEDPVYDFSVSDNVKGIDKEVMKEFITFTSEGEPKTAKVDEYDIKLALTKTTDDNCNYVLNPNAAPKLTVTKAPLTIKVADITREYGEENPKDLTYDIIGFKNNETKDVLTGEITPVYADTIEEKVSVQKDVITAANTLENENYAISVEYPEGTGADLTITKIKVTATAGKAKSSYMTVNFDKAMAGLTKDNFKVMLGTDEVTLTSISPSGNNKSYSLYGTFKPGSTYTVQVEITSDTHEIISEPLQIKPSSSGGGGGGSSSGGSSGGGGIVSSSYTVTFETNGGSKIDSQKVTKNSTVKAPADPTKDKFEFGGWYTDKELKEEFDFDAKITKNITLYAKWIEKNISDTDDVENKPNDGVWNNPFSDVNDKDWFFENVKFVNANGLMSGTEKDKFAPNETLTRGMLVTVLYRLADSPAVNKSVPFTDIAPDAYYKNAVIWAQQNGIVNGVTETEFAPEDNITREQIAAIIHRFAKTMGYDVSVGENTNILSYADYAEISEYAVASMQYAVGSGLIKGKTAETLNPKDNATRAEIAAILQRFIEGNK